MILRHHVALPGVPWWYSADCGAGMESPWWVVSLICLVYWWAPLDPLPGPGVSLCVLSTLGGCTPYVAAQGSRMNVPGGRKGKLPKVWAWKLLVCSIHQIHPTSPRCCRRGLGHPHGKHAKNLLPPKSATGSESVHLPSPTAPHLSAFLYLLLLSLCFPHFRILSDQQTFLSLQTSESGLQGRAASLSEPIPRAASSLPLLPLVGAERAWVSAEAGLGNSTLLSGRGHAPAVSG